jgi:hypothetical protein
MYSDIKRPTRAALETALREGDAIPKAPVSNELLERIRAGVFTSAYTPHAYVEMAVEVFGIARDP